LISAAPTVIPYKERACLSVGEPWSHTEPVSRIEISSQAANTYSKAESDDYGSIKGRASAHSKSDTPSIF